MYYTIGCLRDIIRFSRSTNRDLFRKAQHHIGQLLNISMIQSLFFFSDEKFAVAKVFLFLLQ